MSVIRLAAHSHSHQRRRVLCLLERVGDHQRDRLALVRHLRILQDVQSLADGRIDHALVRAIGQPRRVQVRQHGDHTGSALRSRAVDAWRCGRCATVLRTMAACAKRGSWNSAA